MIHGSAQGSSVGGDSHFTTQASLAKQGWEVLVPDRPGHGRSSDPGRPDDAEADAEWIVKLLGESAHLVGHSFGGCCALAAAARLPSAVRSLTLIEPGMQKLAGADPRVRRFGLKLLLTMATSFSAERRAKRFARLLNIPDEIRGGTTPEEFKRMGRGIAKLKLPSKDTLRGELNIVKEAGIPLLVVTGGWSPSFDAVGETAARIGNGRHVIVRSPHHFPQLVSDEFNRLLVEFMTAADSTSESRRNALKKLALS
jgi:pimeloyl-ACP methyl ester carboxylesterase